MNLTYLALAVTAILTALGLLITGFHVSNVVLGLCWLVTGILAGLNAFGVSTTVHGRHA